jgi:hypothetical protein
MRSSGASKFEFTRLMTEAQRILKKKKNFEKQRESMVSMQFIKDH